jgi:insulysin
VNLHNLLPIISLRFAQFFISPTFNPSSTEREREAVHSEHEKNIGNDSWRLRRLLKHLALKNHPFHNFGTGNRDTLQGLPGKGIRSIIIEFYEENYCSNIMKLVVFGKEDLATLCEMVTTKFENVKSVESFIESSKPSAVDNPYDSTCLKHIIWAKPLKNLKSIFVCYTKRKYLNTYHILLVMKDLVDFSLI